MAKTVINEAASRCACAADELDYIHALLEAIARQSETGSPIHSFATRGARAAAGQASHMHLTTDDLNAEVAHG